MIILRLNKKNLLSAAAGLAIGAVNGLLGAGGGMIAVPLLLKSGLKRKEAHANAVAGILPITLLSVRASLIFIPTGVAGALLGTYCLKKISPLWLKRIFGAFMVYAGVRLLLK